MKGHERKRALGECVNKLRLLESVAKRASESHWEQLTDEIQAAMERASLLLEAGDAELYNRSLNEVKELAAVAEDIEELARGQIDLVEIDQATTQLSVDLKNIVPGKPEKGDTFGLTVLYESTPVRYTEAGALKANWDKTLIQVGSTTGGNG